MSEKCANKLRLGVCAMKRKAESKPMKAILAHIHEYHNSVIELVVFEEKSILHSPVSEWPAVHALLAFHSKGFPLDKAIEYAKLRQPFLINDLQIQATTMMRRDLIYAKLRQRGVDCPRYMVIDHEKEGQCLIETDDAIEYKGIKFEKPFVEKPVSSDDHNIFIYFHGNGGGGGQRLFRKVQDRSSEYDKDLKSVRRDGIYIYEEFMKTEGTDVKVYAIDKDYAHAEARKSPALDGRVQRDKEGKEVRYPIILTRKEKEIARTIVRTFKQVVCGFDLLRANGKSYVCDVNGFSFVKSSQQYYEDFARILGNLILREKARSLGIPWKIPYQADDPPLIRTTTGDKMELRGVIAVIRHGDRTPKQKMKMRVKDRRLFAIFQDNIRKEMLRDSKTDKTAIKLKHPAQMIKILKFVQAKKREIQEERENMRRRLSQIEDYAGTGNILEDEFQELNKQMGIVNDALLKYESIERVLTMYGDKGSIVFEGINRKVQLKLCFDDVGNEEILLILKWGGELTNAGRLQAESLGHIFRTLYPGLDDGISQYGFKGRRGLGFLRLHNTYRHDLKIYASDEGRVKLTAAAFTKGLLALEGELPPILTQMVKSANTDGLLDAEDKDAYMVQQEVKKRLQYTFQRDVEIDEQMIRELNPLESVAISRALRAIGNPRRCMEELEKLVEDLVKCIERQMMSNIPQTHVLSDETWHTVHERWTKLLRDLRLKDGVYDLSKVPDIYDCVKYDLQHNVAIHKIFDNMNMLYFVSKCLAEVVVPQEYGITKNEKLRIAEGICLPLLKKIRQDLKRCIEPDTVDNTEFPTEESAIRLDPKARHITTPLRYVRTRLYFTSESHIHSLMNLIRYRELVQNSEDQQWKLAMEFLSRTCEFNYMTQLVLMIYEDTSKSQASPERFHLEIHFSPGLLPYYKGHYAFPHLDYYYSPGGYRPKSCEDRSQSRRKHNSGPPTRPNKPCKDDTGSSDEEKRAGTLINLDTTTQLNQPPISEMTWQCARDHVWHAVFVAHEELKEHSPTGSMDVGHILDPISEPGCAARVHAQCVSRVPSIAGPGQLPHTQNPSFTTRSLVFAKKFRNELISTDVIKGVIRKDDNTDEESEDSTPAVLSTAVFARGNSAPDLKVFDAERCIPDTMVHQVGKFITPMRSLETLHNGLSFSEFDQLVDRIVATRTPLPSPESSYISRENSNLSDPGSSYLNGVEWSDLSSSMRYK